MPTDEQKKKKKQEIIESWNNLREKILSKFFSLQEQHQDHLNWLFVELDSEDSHTWPLERNYTYEQVLAEVKRIQKEVRELNTENLKLKGVEIEEVD